MKAVVYKKYGAPDVLSITEIAKPIPKKNEVLIKIHATTVAAGDVRMRKADPFLVRLFNGLLRPKKNVVLGFELAGVVEEIGGNIKRFKRGDEIFASCGFSFGAYAEYKCLPEDGPIAMKPNNITFKEAAGVPVGARTALRFLRKGDIHKGQKVLIYGASGSVGTYAVQIAKHFSADVTGVCSTSNVELIKSLGAKKVIDYTQESIVGNTERYDFIFDAVGKASKSDCKKVLTKKGKFISVMGSAKERAGDLDFLKDLIESDRVKPVIDREYHLEEIIEAHEYVEKGHKIGNVVVTI